MPHFIVPPVSPPTAPRDGDDINDVILWSKRISGYLVQQHQFIEQNADAYIASNAQLGTDLIGTDNIIDSAVTSPKIADSAVTTSKYENSSITTIKLIDSAVTTLKIQDSGVTTNKYENSSITTIKLIDSAVTTLKLENSAATSDKIQNSAVTNTELVTITTDAATAHAVIGDSVVVSYAISRDKKPLVVPQVSAAGWLASLSYVTTDSVEITAYNNSGATSCTVYANYH